MKNVLAALFGTAALAAFAAGVQAQQIKFGADDIAGTVRGPKGPEAGVWVIAETTELPTKFTRIVVTDAKGRYLIPDLPKASYSVWVRGYGLVDSPKVRHAPGRILNLGAVPAPSAKEAAQYYPAIHWFSLLRVPGAREFPLGPVQSQGQWLNTIKSGACQSCHALGTPGTRIVPEFFAKGRSSVEAWRERLKAGSAMALMARDIGRLDSERALKEFADWTDRIAAGELPFSRPERPKGIERNVVITEWEWSKPQYYLHDIVATDRLDPGVNAGGRVYASPEDSTDLVPWLDPKTGQAGELAHPLRDPETPSVTKNPFGPSAWWGDKPIWDGHTLNHNPMIDGKGRVWFTSRISPDANPQFCKSGSDHPSAKAFPLNGGANRHLSMYDPAKNEWQLVRTCFPTHHLNFSSDGILWTSAGVVGPAVIGWLDVKRFEETHDEQRSQGWSPLVLDTNGDGKRGPFTNPDEPADSSKDRRVNLNLYAIAVAPNDGSLWGTAIGYPGQVVRIVPGEDPTSTALTEVYEPPLPGFGPRGGDVDSNGVYWVSLSSGHLARFDRSRCKVTNGPKATGSHCKEGWTLHAFPGPQIRGLKAPGSAEASYYVWVDRFGVFGLGRNVPIAMGNLSDSIYAFKGGRFIRIRLPYPGGLFPKNVDGRIDDANAGWKGRALWTTTGTRVPFHNEGGTQARPRAVKIQLRPDPLAQ